MSDLMMSTNEAQVTRLGRGIYRIIVGFYEKATQGNYCLVKNYCILLSDKSQAVKNQQEGSQPTTEDVIWAALSEAARRSSESSYGVPSDSFLDSSAPAIAR